MNKRMMFSILAMVIFLFTATAQAVQYVDLPPLNKRLANVHVGNYKADADKKLFIITWGADWLVVHGNGDSLKTQPGSIFASKGLTVTIEKEDSVQKQMEDYLKGDVVYLRMTAGMLNQGIEALSKDPRTQPVQVAQLSWSGGKKAGDCLVVKGNIKNMKDLIGKEGAMQIDGPHLDLHLRFLKDAQMSYKDVRLRFTEDLTQSKNKNAPPDAFLEKNISFAYMISDDAMTLTSGGKVGTGGEGSVKGAWVMQSTKIAKRVIADEYYVRRDYAEAHPDKVQAFAQAIMLADEETNAIFNGDHKRPEYKRMATAGAKIIFGGETEIPAMEGAWGDCETPGFSGNVSFFLDANNPRGAGKLNDEIQTAYMGIGLLTKKFQIGTAKLDYNAMRAGLTTNIKSVVIPVQAPAAVAKAIEKQRSSGRSEYTQFEPFEIYFDINQVEFDTAKYIEAFDRAIDFRVTYTGAVSSIQAYMDPTSYVKNVQNGAPEQVLKAQLQRIKTDSLKRAEAVRDAVIKRAAERKIKLTADDFTVEPMGIKNPVTKMCGAIPCLPKEDEKWRNRRAVFQIFNIESEE